MNPENRGPQFKNLRHVLTKRRRIHKFGQAKARRAGAKKNKVIHATEDLIGVANFTLGFVLCWVGGDVRWRKRRLRIQSQTI